MAASNAAHEAQLRREEEARESERVARRRYQRLSILLAVVAALAIGAASVAIATSIYANRQSQRAEAATTQAKQQQQRAEDNLDIALAAGDMLVRDVGLGLRDLIGMPVERSPSSVLIFQRGGRGRALRMRRAM